MNVVSYINGDAQVTDFPTGSARPLSMLVQICNDALAGPDGYLSPENSVLALELAWQTVGTADVSDSVVHAWIAELLTNPTWGLVRYAPLTAIKAIVDVAQLHRAAASGDVAPSGNWDAAARAVRSMSPTLQTAGRYAVQAAYDSTALAGSNLALGLDEVIAHAVNAHAIAAERTAASRLVEVTRHAIRSWRYLASPAGAVSPAAAA